MAKKLTIETISLPKRLKIHVVSFFCGLWMLTKKCLKTLFWNKEKQNLGLPDSPPSCLQDSNMGVHKYVKIRDIKFHYLEVGSPENPPVLLLHGFPDFWLGWRYQISVLSNHFHVIVLDLKGFGDSDKPLSRYSYTPSVILEELRQLIFSLGIKNCVLIGHDLGALLGWYLVHENPGLVSKFIAVSCPHPNIYWKSLNSNSRHYQLLNFAQLPHLPEIDVLKENIKIINEYHKHLIANDPYLEAYKYTYSRREDWTGPINYYRNFLLCKTRDELKLDSDVSVLLLSGTKDEIVNLEGVVKSAEFCAKFDIKLVDNTGHFPHQENPEEFNKVLLKSLISNSLKNVPQSPSKILNIVSSTVAYGNTMIGNVQKKTTDVISNIPVLNKYV